MEDDCAPEVSGTRILLCAEKNLANRPQWQRSECTWFATRPPLLNVGTDSAEYIYL